MEFLGDQTKNLAARLGKQGAIDKKVERQIRLDLQERSRSQLEELTKSTAKG